MSGSDADPLATVVSVVSPASGTGRTSAVVNLGWILASAGKRVLIADLDAQHPSAVDYLRPFQVETRTAGELLGADRAAELGSRVSLAWQLPGLNPAGPDAALPVERYRLPGGVVGLDLVRLAHRGKESDRTKLAGSAELVRLKAALQSLAYDYLILDHPTDASEAAMTRTAMVSDVAAVCFRLLPTHIPDARRLAAGIRDGSGERVRIVAVPTQVPEHGGRSTDQPMSLVRAAFGRSAIVEIPYRPYGYDAPLAVLVDEPTDRSGLLASYERLTWEITGGAVSRLVPVPAGVRDRYRRGLGLEPVKEPEAVTVVYAVEDRPWADWIQAQFERAGLRVERSTGGCPTGSPRNRTVIAVVSPSLAGSPAGSWLAEVVRSTDRQGAEPVEVVGVQVEPTPRSGPVAALGGIDLSERAETRARAELLSRFGLILTTPEPSIESRFPGRRGQRPQQTNVAPRNPAFVGRHLDLEQLRDALVNDRSRVLSGAPGSGKSEIAREYAHRFGHNYDVVWWLAADQSDSLRDGLAGLARALGIEGAGDPVTAVVAELAQLPQPWLLVYDNADNPARLLTPLPDLGLGHLLITSRSVDWPAPCSLQRTAPFTVPDGVRLLTRHVQSLDVAVSERVAAEVGFLPIAVGLAGRWLADATDRLRQQGATVAESADWAGTEFLALYGRRVAEPGAPPSQEGWDTAEAPAVGAAAACLAVTFETLRTSRLGRLAVRLAELCAFLSPGGVALPLLCSAGMLTQLAQAGSPDGAAIRQDGAELFQVLRVGERAGLFEVDRGQSMSLRMHRMLQDLIRASMSVVDRAARREQVLRGLADYAPTDAEADEPAHTPRYAELGRHLEPSGALDSADRVVRRWLVQQIRYVYREGDLPAWQAAVGTGRWLLHHWTGSVDTDDLRLRLAVQVANLCRALGDYDQALTLDESVQRDQRRALGLTHPRTLITGRGRAGDLRGLGRFREALAEDEATWSGFCLAYGEDHPDTLMASSNLALSAFLVGDYQTALTHWQEVAARRHRLFPATNPLIWHSEARVAICLREIGRLDEAARILHNALDHIMALRLPVHRDEMRIRHDIAVLDRLAGRSDAALRQQMRVQRGYLATLGGNHPETQAGLLSLAADYHAEGQLADAFDLGRRCRDWYAGRSGSDHPFTQLCQVDVALFHRSVGELDQAVKQGRAALEGLSESLGESHPWALAAALNQAGHLAAAGELAAAVELEEVTEELCADALGSKHLYTKQVAENLLVSRRGLTGSGGGTPARRRDVYLEVPRT